MSDEPSIDPALAHLYTDDLGDEPSFVGRRRTLEELVTELEGPDDVTDADVTELAILVEDQIRRGTMSDTESVALGLGDLAADGTFDLNRTGLAVVRRMAEREGLIPPR